LEKSGGHLRAIDPRAVDRIDLLSVVEHELGHIAGLDDTDLLAGGLMDRTLSRGIRRNPGILEQSGLLFAPRVADWA
jgi:hypothetical protein